MNKKLFNWNVLKIMTLFASDLNIAVYGREIARKLKMNQRTVKLYLDILEKEKILIGKVKGKNKEFILNRNLLTKRLLVMAEQYKMFKLFDNFEIYDIISSLINFADMIVVYGGFAKGYFRKDSDLDILVINGGIKKINEIKKKYNRKIHVMDMPRKKFIDGIKRKDNFILDILHNHIICSGAEEFIDLRWEYA